MKSPPIKILHVLFVFGLGGIETWLMNLLRRWDLDRFGMDFLIHDESPSPYEDEIRKLGCKYIRCPRPVHLLRHRRRFREILQNHGPYQVVHSHVSYVGWILRLARQAGVPGRVAHHHLDRKVHDDTTLLRRWFLRWTHRWTFQEANAGLACSANAAEAMFGLNWRSDPRWQVMLYGMDFQPFRTPVDRLAVRREMGIPADAWVVGNVGRLVEQKNHALLIKIAGALAPRDPNFRLLLVGEGPLRDSLTDQVRALGLSDRTVFAGPRQDIPQMLAAMDAFVCPSLYEGLGLVNLEAQAAGLPTVLSAHIPSEVDVLPDRLTRVSLEAPLDRWVDAILATRNAPRHAIESGLDVLEQSEFSIAQNVKRLESLYQNLASSPVRP